MAEIRVDADSVLFRQQCEVLDSVILDISDLVSFYSSVEPDVLLKILATDARFKKCMQLGALLFNQIVICKGMFDGN